MIKVQVRTQNSYDVLLGKGLLQSAGVEISKVVLPSKVLVVTDDNVEKLYLKDVKNALKDAGFEVFSQVIENGEKHKTPQTYLSVISKMAELELNRQDLVVALGGGVTGDIAGFAAATYMRGISVVQMPTTLLAGIDASVGGKTGVDLEAGKNLLGAFHQPKLVLFDLNTLDTLSQIDWQNGLGEGIKYAILCGGEMFDILEKGLDCDNILRFCELAVIAKRDIVERDEKESGERKLLNLGHTFGHAIEQLSKFQIPHGVAVAKGICLVAKAGKKSGVLSGTDFERISRLFEKYDLDTSCHYDHNELLKAIKMDKKVKAKNTISFVDIVAIGNCTIKTVEISTLGEYANGC